MKIRKIELTNFRNYKSLKIDIKNQTNIFVGKNAQGKTSILESIYMLAFTKSHKVPKDKDVIKNDTDFTKISALINLNDKDIDLDIIVSKVGKKAKYNQIEVDKLSDYIGLLNVVFFAPEDLELIKGNPKTRRKFLDIELGQISRKYIHNLQNYNRVLKQRNDLLKTMQKTKNKDYLLLDVITDQLIGYQKALIKDRETFIEKIKKYSKHHYKELSNTDDDFTITYKPSIKSNFKKEYTKKYEYDIITGTTNLGIHRDEIEFYINDFFMKSHASQGEQRTAILAIKLALIDFIYEYKETYPILLLDDVLSELDEFRQISLLKHVNNQIQTFITTTDINSINTNLLNNHTIYEVENGQIKECIHNGK